MAEQTDLNPEYEILFQQAPIAYFVLNDKLTILNANHAAYQLLQFEENQGLNGKSIQLYVNPGSYPFLNKHFQKAQESGSDRTIMMMIHQDGSLVPATLQTHFDLASEKFFTTATLLPERSQAENVQYSGIMYRDLVENSLTGVAVTNLAGDILYANKTVLDIMEYDTLDEIREGGVLTKYRNPEDRQRLIQELQTKGKVNQFEFDVYTRSNTIKTLLLSAVLQGQNLHITLLHITERKQEQQALQQSEGRYRRITELISDYAYSLHVASDGTLSTLWITGDSFLRVTGYDYRQIGHTNNIYHPDDRERAEEDLLKTRQGIAVSGEYRIITKSGETRWLSIQRQIEWDHEQAHVTRIYGIAQDITKRKLAEDSLRTSEERYRWMSETSSDYAFVAHLSPEGETSSERWATKA